MTITKVEFPNSPVHGSTYTYLGIRYIFVKQDADGVAFTEGYWTTSTSGSYSAASVAEINAGTENFKYISPLELSTTKYTREDETSGRTELKNSGTVKLNTSSSGVQVSGTLGVTGSSTIGGTLGVTGVITGTLNGSATSAGTAGYATNAGNATTSGSSTTSGYATTSGNAATATKLATARTIDITGDITATAVAFDGSNNIVISASVNNNSHTHTGSTLSAISGAIITSGTISDARLPATISSDITGSSASCTGNSATASYATSAGFATSATSATNANYATNAGYATSAGSAGSAGSASTASNAYQPAITRVGAQTNLTISDPGISYNGSSAGGGTANSIGFRWSGSRIIGVVDNVVAHQFAIISEIRPDYTKTSLFGGAAASGTVSTGSMSSYDAIMVETAGDSSYRTVHTYQRSLVTGNTVIYHQKGSGNSYINFRFNSSSLSIVSQYALGGNSYIVRVYGIKY